MARCPLAAVSMAPRSLRCPRCSTVITAEAGQTATCPACGFTGPAPPPATPAPGTLPPPLSPLPGPTAASAWGPPAAGGFSSLPDAPQQRPAGVTFVGVVGIILGALGAFGGLILAHFGSIFAAAFRNYRSSTGASFGAALATILAIVGILLIAYAVLQIVVGANVLKGRPWARTTQLVLSFLGGFIGLTTLVVGNFVALVTVGLDIAIIVVLFGREAQQYFAHGRPNYP
jgi:hypothetical protein